MQIPRFPFYYSSIQSNIPVLSIKFINETFLNETTFHGKPISLQPTSNIFLIFPLAINISLSTNSIKRPFKKPMKVTLTLIPFLISTEFCIAELIIERKEFVCVGNKLICNEKQPCIFNFTNDGVFSIVNLTMANFGQIQLSTCDDFACQHPLAIAGIVLGGILLILLALFIVRVLFF